MTKPPPPLFLPLNRDPAHAIEQAIAVLNTIVEKHPEVRRDFDCEAFIHHELAPALEAKRAEAWIEEELKDGDKICEAAGVQRTEGGRLQVAKIIAKLSARPEAGALDLPGTIRLAIWFHETYEELAPLYGYETRPESRTFDASSPNGKLMLAVCRKLREQYAVSPQKTP